MGRKGKTWKRIKAITVTFNDEVVTISLDEQEKVKDHDELNKIKKATADIEVKELNTAQITNDEPLISSIDNLTNDCSFNIYDSFEESFFFDSSFGSYLDNDLYLDPPSDAIFGNLTD